jgi:hypothetical protein
MDDVSDRRQHVGGTHRRSISHVSMSRFGLAKCSGTAARGRCSTHGRPAEDLSRPIGRGRIHPTFIPCVILITQYGSPLLTKTSGLKPMKPNIANRNSITSNAKPPNSVSTSLLRTRPLCQLPLKRQFFRKALLCVASQTETSTATLPIRVDLPESCFHLDQQS